MISLLRRALYVLALLPLITQAKPCDIDINSRLTTATAYSDPQGQLYLVPSFSNERYADKYEVHDLKKCDEITSGAGASIGNVIRTLSERGFVVWKTFSKTTRYNSVDPFIRNRIKVEPIDDGDELSFVVEPIPEAERRFLLNVAERPFDVRQQDVAKYGNSDIFATSEYQSVVKAGDATSDQQLAAVDSQGYLQHLMLYRSIVTSKQETALSKLLSTDRYRSYLAGYLSVALHDSEPLSQINAEYQQLTASNFDFGAGQGLVAARYYKDQKSLAASQQAFARNPRDYLSRLNGSDDAKLFLRNRRISVQFDDRGESYRLAVVSDVEGEVLWHDFPKNCRLTRTELPKTENVAGYDVFNVTTKVDYTTCTADLAVNAGENLGKLGEDPSAAMQKVSSLLVAGAYENNPAFGIVMTRLALPPTLSEYESSRKQISRVFAYRDVEREKADIAAAQEQRRRQIAAAEQSAANARAYAAQQERISGQREAMRPQCEATVRSCEAQCEGLSNSDGGAWNDSSRYACQKRCPGIFSCY